MQINNITQNATKQHVHIPVLHTVGRDWNMGADGPDEDVHEEVICQICGIEMEEKKCQKTV